MQKLGTENRTPGPKVSGISAPPSPEPAQRDCGLLSSLADGAVLLTCFSVPLGGCPTQTPEGLGQGLVTAKVDSQDSGSRAKPVGRSPRKLGGFGNSDEFRSWWHLVWSPRSARNHQAARCVPPKATASLGRSRRLHLQPPRSDPPGAVAAGRGFQDACPGSEHRSPLQKPPPGGRSRRARPSHR